MQARRFQLVLASALLCSGSAWAQSTNQPPPPASDSNAFPQAQSEAAAKKAAGQDTQAPAAAKPAANDNAFPEAESEAAAKKAAEDEKADSAAAGSGAAAGEDTATSSSSREKMAGLDLLGDNDSRIANGAGGVVLNPKLAAEDVKVGQQYAATGNYTGAYSRFKEATQVDPGNADAVFFLAEAARRTAHLDEAATDYKLYLQVEANGSKAKQARKALAQLEGK